MVVACECQSAFHALRPEDLRRALRFFSACGVQTNEKTFGVHNLFGSWRAELHAAQVWNRILLQVTDVMVHNLQLFDTTFIEISGGPFPLQPSSFSGVQNYKFNKLNILWRTTQIPWRTFGVQFTWNATWCEFSSDNTNSWVLSLPSITIYCLT